MVFHAEQQYHDDIQPLQNYLKSELNVRDIVFTTDEQNTGVKYRALADWPVLGRKLRKEMNRVKKALPEVPSDDIKNFVQTGKVTVDGIELVTGDITVLRYVEVPADGSHATATDNDVVLILDTQLHPELEGEGIARDFIGRVQRLRKKAGLQATDDVDVFYSFTEGVGEALKGIFVSHADIIQKTTRSAAKDATTRPADASVLLEEAQEIGEVPFVLSLSKPATSQ